MITVRDNIENTYPESFKNRYNLGTVKEKYILKALNSILSESLDIKFELISRNTKYRPVITGYNPI
jgi:hypothetical protein